MNTVSAQQIKEFYTEKLKAASVGDIRSFLLLVAETLKDVKRNTLVHSDFLFEVSELVHLIRVNIFLPNKKFPRNIEMSYAQIKGLMQELEQLMDDGNLDRRFFGGVYELGIMLEELAHFVKVVMPIIAVYHDWGSN